MIKAVPLCLALALVAGTASAQLPVGAEFQVNTYTTGRQSYPRVSASASGDFVVVWKTAQNPGDASDIYARRYTSGGTTIGGEFRVSSRPGSYDHTPAVAMARTGEFVVVWTGSGYCCSAIKGQRYDAFGIPAGTEFFANLTAYWQFDPVVAMDANGNFVVVWASSTQDGNHNGVFGRRFDAVGTPIGLEFAVNSYTAGRQDSPELAVAPAGDFVVVWHSDGQDGSYYGVFGQRFSAVAQPLGAEFSVNTTTVGFQRFPVVASSAAGDFVVAWSGDYGYSIGIIARRFAASGIPASGEFLVNQQTTTVKEWPAVASDPAGNFLVSWASDAQDGDGRGVYARPFDPWGTAVGPEFQVNTFTTSGQSLPSVSMGGHGAFVMAWVSFQQDSTNSLGVFGQRFSDLIFGDGFEP